jgi:hypothetical protein
MNFLFEAEFFRLSELSTAVDNIVCNYFLVYSDVFIG